MVNEKIKTALQAKHRLISLSYYNYVEVRFLIKKALCYYGKYNEHVIFKVSNIDTKKYYEIITEANSPNVEHFINNTMLNCVFEENSIVTDFSENYFDRLF